MIYFCNIPYPFTPRSYVSIVDIWLNGREIIHRLEYNDFIADGVLADHAQDSISSGIASDDPYCPTSPSTFSDQSSPVRSRQSAVDSGRESVQRRSRPCEENSGSVYLPSNRISHRTQQKPSACYQYRHSDMTSFTRTKNSTPMYEQYPVAPSGGNNYEHFWMKGTYLSNLNEEHHILDNSRKRLNHFAEHYRQFAFVCWKKWVSK